MSDEPDAEQAPDEDTVAPRAAPRFGPETHVVPADWHARAVATMDETLISAQTALAWIYMRDDEVVADLAEVSPDRLRSLMAWERERRPTYYPEFSDAQAALLKSCRAGTVKVHGSAGDSATEKDRSAPIPGVSWFGATLYDQNGGYVAGPEPGRVGKHFHHLLFDRDQVLAAWPPLFPVPQATQEVEKPSDPPTTEASDTAHAASITSKPLPKKQLEILSAARDIWPDDVLPARVSDRDELLRGWYTARGRTAPSAKSFQRAFGLDKSGQ